MLATDEERIYSRLILTPNKYMTFVHARTPRLWRQHQIIKAGMGVKSISD